MPLVTGDAMHGIFVNIFHILVEFRYIYNIYILIPFIRIHRYFSRILLSSNLLSLSGLIEYVCMYIMKSNAMQCNAMPATQCNGMQCSVIDIMKCHICMYTHWYTWQCVNTLYPCSSHQNSWDLWMFIPLKMVLIGIDPYPHIYIYISSIWDTHDLVASLFWSTPRRAVPGWKESRRQPGSIGCMLGPLGCIHIYIYIYRYVIF